MLDSSAVIAYLRGEPGKERVVAALLDESVSCQMHAVNLCEVFCDTLRAQGMATSENVLADLALIGVRTVTEMNSDLLKEAGQLKVRYRISLADAFALALMKRCNAKLLTADHHEFDAIVASGEGGIVFIR